MLVINPLMTEGFPGPSVSGHPSSSLNVSPELLFAEGRGLSQGCALVIEGGFHLMDRFSLF